MPLIVVVDNEVIGRRQESRGRSGDVLSEVLCYAKMYVLNWLRWRRCNGTPKGTMEWKEWKVLTGRKRQRSREDGTGEKSRRGRDLEGHAH